MCAGVVTSLIFANFTCKQDIREVIFLSYLFSSLSNEHAIIKTHMEQITGSILKLKSLSYLTGAMKHLLQNISF